MIIKSLKAENILKYSNWSGKSFVSACTAGRIL